MCSKHQHQLLMTSTTDIWWQLLWYWNQFMDSKCKAHLWMGYPKGCLKICTQSKRAINLHRLWSLVVLAYSAQESWKAKELEQRKSWCTDTLIRFGKQQNLRHSQHNSIFLCTHRLKAELNSTGNVEIRGQWILMLEMQQWGNKMEDAWRKWTCKNGAANKS